jgi:hypothetical protein
MTSPRLKALFLFALACSEPAWAATSIVAFVQGTVTVNGRPARSGHVLEEGALVVVGEGRATLILDSDRVVHLGPKTRLKLDDLKEGSQVDVKLDYGAVRSLVKSNSDRLRSFRVKTPSAVMGVRGTQFFVDLPPAGSMTGEGLRVATLEGQVSVWDGRAPTDAPPKPTLLNGGQSIQVSAATAAGAVAPKPLSELPVKALSDSEVKEVRAATQAAARPLPGAQGPMGNIHPPQPPGLNGGPGFGNPGFMQGFNPPMRIDLTIE